MIRMATMKFLKPFRIVALLVTLAIIVSPDMSAAASPLPALAANSNELTVSGLSSGGYMAVQYQVAHAATVKGAGILAGGPYYCAEGKVSRALANCMAPRSDTLLPTVAEQKKSIDAAARAGQIDPPERLAGHRVWLFSGGNDRTVETIVVDALQDFYASILPTTAIRYVRRPDAGHALPSVADKQANACATSEPPFINYCGDFDAPGDLLAHLLGPLQARVGTPDGDLLAFDQTPFIHGKAIDASLADEGFIFIPRGCRKGGCRVHVAFHGCRQSVSEIGRRFVDGAGYNAWASNNRLIVLYPQTVARNGAALGSWKFVINPKGCWDWWGYSGENYASREAIQIKAVRRMVERLQEKLQ